ncbi:perosamine synthetase [Alsobacter metallidurans]|uniref:GDP-perosamine synthase n=1 Tax=Alsobacter metallidurans TaxID=340221 RepID=A0A917I673_9HYPH|nr:LegC family aminotransferase [Alsobacter metallidurans]GGH15603.1 perosamine synthetase [Alsobacter metallidurans]
MTSVDNSRLIDALKGVLGPADALIPLHEPRFAGREWELLKDCLDTGWVSSVGQYVDGFEARLAETCGAGRAVAVVNGTAALHMALLVAGVRPDDEVIVPTLTFVATVNAVVYCGAVPHLVDSEMLTLGMDPAKLGRHLERIGTRRDGVLVNRETGRTIRAIVPMHTFGHPVDMDRLNAIAEQFGLPVIEDATESLGTLYKGRPSGSLAPIGTLSFNGNKIVTTGGGGAVLTHDPVLGARAKHLTTTAKVPHRWAFDHDELGYNYRLPNLNAALGVAQLEQLPGFLDAKRALAERYAQALEGVSGLRFFREPAFARSNYWLNAVLLDADDEAERDRVLQATNDAGLMTRPVWTVMHKLSMYRDCPRDDLSVAESIGRRLINIPSSAKHGLR